MDKQARKLNTPKEDGAPSEVGSEAGSNEESDHDEKVGKNNEKICCLKKKYHIYYLYNGMAIYFKAHLFYFTTQKPKKCM